MSFVGSMLGIGSQANNPSQGASGINFQAQNANIQSPSTVEQAKQLYGQSQSGLDQQQKFLQALQAQNGIGNQSSVFNQLQGVANGTGPNPAQAMLSQATGNNVANQAALMAGQRGAGANAGLIARQAAQQGAATQQQAAGQGATLQANQSLGALNQLGGIAGQQVGQQAGALTGLNQATQNEQQNVLSGITGQNNANVGMQSNINSTNSGLANTVAQGQQGIVGGLLGGVGSALGLPKAEGGLITKPKMYADGGPALGVDTDLSGPSSNAGRSLNPGYNQNKSDLSSFMPNQGPASAPQSGASAMQQGIQSVVGGAGGAGMSGLKGLIQSAGPAAVLAAKGGKVPALVSPGERYLPPKEVEKVAKGEKNPMKAGEKIPGKPKVGGARNSYANDTVPKTLDEGGVVLPRSVTMAKDPAKAAHAFVSAIVARNKGMR